MPPYHAEARPNEERRRHPQLRAIYSDARVHIDHLFHNRHDWAGSPIDYLAHRVIHEAYPHLRGEEVRILVGAIGRTHESLAAQENARPDHAERMQSDAVLT